MKTNRIENVIIIGAMKSGTSSLYNYLIKHPEICPCKTKEPEFFSHTLGNKQYKKGEYLELFGIKEKTHKFTLEASTGYSKYPLESGVPKRIKEYGLAPKIIYIVRNPFERIQSHYNFMREDLTWKSKIDSSHLINTSNYFMQLEEYRKFFPLQDILILDFEDLKIQPKKMCQDVFKFIGASRFNLENNYEVINKTVTINRRKSELIKPLKLFSKWTPSFLKKSTHYLLELIVPTKQKQLTKRQKKKIYELLKTDMINLKHTYNIEVSKWGFTA